MQQIMIFLEDDERGSIFVGNLYWYVDNNEKVVSEMDDLIYITEKIIVLNNIKTPCKVTGQLVGHNKMKITEEVNMKPPNDPAFETGKVVREIFKKIVSMYIFE